MTAITQLWFSAVYFIDVINVYYIFYSGHVFNFFPRFFYLKKVVKCKLWICKTPTKFTLP